MDPDIVLCPYIVAKIECGADGINRNYSSPIKALWNWHVTEFVEFSEVCGPDGHPALVQNDCQGWMEDTNGYIGFGNYTVLEEIGTDPNNYHSQSDFDYDSKVNNEDFSWLGGYWLDFCNEPNWCGGSDLNKSGAVDNNDLKIFGRSWLNPFGGEPVWLDCWAIPRQCHGDADGLAGGNTMTGYYYVTSSDLNILMGTLGSRYGEVGPPAYDGRADFDRDGDVDEDDLYDIWMMWYKVFEPPMGSGVPVDCPTQ